MEWMRRNRRAIAVVALLGMATPFVAQLVSRLTQLDPMPVVLILLALIVLGLGATVMKRGTADRDNDL